MKFSICVIPANTSEWQILDEGPWDSRAEAVMFAVAECGSPWCVLSDGRVFAVGDARGNLAHTC